jgi:predicted transcriptional regulator of viral defense system
MTEGGRINDATRRSAAQAAVEDAITRATAPREGIAKLTHLLDAGLSARSAQRLAASGRLHRVSSGVYSAVPPKLLTRNARYHAAVLAAGDGAVLSHYSAAALLGIRPSGRTKIDVTVPGRSRRTIRGVVVHRSNTLTKADQTIVEGVPTTSAARTLLDLAARLDRRGLEKALDQSEILELFDLTALTDVIARNPTAPGAGTLRSTLAEHYPGSTPTRSELEERFLPIVRGAGLPLPELNVDVVLPDGGPAIKADALWRAQRLIVELDGRGTHGTRQAFERDRYRDQRAVVGGWRVIRFTWRQLTREAERIAVLLASLLGV